MKVKNRRFVTTLMFTMGASALLLAVFGCASAPVVHESAHQNRVLGTDLDLASYWVAGAHSRGDTTSTTYRPVSSGSATMEADIEAIQAVADENIRRYGLAPNHVSA